MTKSFSIRWLGIAALLLVCGPWLGAAEVVAPAADTVRWQTIWSAPQAHAGDQRVLAIVLNIGPGYHVNPDAPQIPANFDFLVPTTLQAAAPSAGVRFGPVQFPQADLVQVNYTGKAENLRVFRGRTVLFLPVVLGPDVPPGQMRWDMELGYQACNERSCLQPRSVRIPVRLEIVPAGVATTTQDVALFQNFDATVFSRMSGSKTARLVRLDVFGRAWSADVATTGGLLLLLFLAGVGGLLLNFTPCVLPMIPLKVLSLAQLAQHRGRCLALGVVMALGIVVFWLGLAVAIATISGFTATNQLFQYPAFTVMVGVVLAVMGLGMGGLFTLRLPNFVYAINPKQESVAGSFGFGIMTAVLSTPCTAPFMGAAAAWATTQAPIITLLTFTAIGVGMALPYLLLAAFPQWAAKMPRTGRMSELIKQVMGLLILAAAAYFIGVGISGWITQPPDSPSRLYWWAVALGIAAAGVWLVGGAWRAARNPASKGALVAYALGLLLVVSAVYIGWQFTRRGPIAWVNYTPQRLAEAQAGGKIVVMDFTAEWCLNCKTMEETVLHNRQVVALLRRPQVVPMKVDLTGHNVEGARQLQATGRLTIPLLVIYAPDGREVFKSDYYTVQQVLDAVKRTEK